MTSFGLSNSIFFVTTALIYPLNVLLERFRLVEKGQIEQFFYFDPGVRILIVLGFQKVPLLLVLLHVQTRCSP